MKYYCPRCMYSTPFHQIYKVRSMGVVGFICLSCQKPIGKNALYLLAWTYFLKAIGKHIKYELIKENNGG